MRSSFARLCAAVGVAALLLVAVGCIPIPPDTFRPEQFPPGQGPNIVRAEVFQGLGAWWDVNDWSPTYAEERVNFGLGDVDRLAIIGVQTLYIETATRRHPADLLDEALLRQIVDRARGFGMRVVGWYEPQFTDEALDVRRMTAAIDFGFDGFVIDIGSKANPDADARSLVLIREVAALRAAYPNLPLATRIVAPLEWIDHHPEDWPRFPYATLAPQFDAWMPLNLWTYRRWRYPSSSAYFYSTDNVNLLRRLTGVAWLPVHPIGGAAEETTNDDMADMYRAMRDTYSIGGSLDDESRTSPTLWERLRWFRIPK